VVGNGNYNAENNTRKKAKRAIHIRPVDHLILRATRTMTIAWVLARWRGPRHVMASLAGRRILLRAGFQYAQTRRTWRRPRFRIVPASRPVSATSQLSVGRSQHGSQSAGRSNAYPLFASISANTFFVGGATSWWRRRGSHAERRGHRVRRSDVAGPPKPDTDVMARLTFQAKFCGSFPAVTAGADA
jgi:hypothetical protein